MIIVAPLAEHHGSEAQLADRDASAPEALVIHGKLLCLNAGLRAGAISAASSRRYLARRRHRPAQFTLCDSHTCQGAGISGRIRCPIGHCILPDHGTGHAGEQRRARWDQPLCRNTSMTWAATCTDRRRGGQPRSAVVHAVTATSISPTLPAVAGAVISADVPELRQRAPGFGSLPVRGCDRAGWQGHRARRRPGRGRPESRSGHCRCARAHAAGVRCARGRGGASRGPSGVRAC
jgi:hypothetical protein